MKPTQTQNLREKQRIDSVALVILDLLTSRVEPIRETESAIGQRTMKGTKSTQLINSGVHDSQIFHLNGSGSESLEYEKFYLKLNNVNCNAVAVLVVMIKEKTNG